MAFVTGAEDVSGSTGARLPDRVSVGVVVRRFPPDLVDAVVNETGVRERRQRSLPAGLTVYLTLAMWLWREEGYEQVLRRLIDGLRWAGVAAVKGDVAWSGSIAKARVRLGAEPLRSLFVRSAGASAAAGTDWRGLRPTALDGARVTVPGSDANRIEFGGPTVRLQAHAECGTRALLDATFDGRRTTGAELAGRLLGSLRPGMLVMADWDVLPWGLWRAAAGTGAHLLWQAGDASAGPVLRRLVDGGHLSRREPSAAGEEPVTVRVVVAPTGAGPTLLTTLLDPDVWPSDEIIALFRRRWRMDTLWDTVGAGGPVHLRSHSPAGIRQEIWALLCLNQALVDVVNDRPAAPNG